VRGKRNQRAGKEEGSMLNRTRSLGELSLGIKIGELGERKAWT